MVTRTLPSSFLRRVLVTGLALAASFTTLSACSKILGTHTVHLSTSQMQKKLDARFPLTRNILGIAPVTISKPVLGTEPLNNKITTKLAVDAPSVLTLTPAINGHIDIAYSLRLEPSDNTIRMTQVEVRKVDLRDTAGRSMASINDVVQQAGQKWLQDYTVYTLTEADLTKIREYNYKPANLVVKSDGVDLELERN